jgi:hypothetical protein
VRRRGGRRETPAEGALAGGEDEAGFERRIAQVIAWCEPPAGSADRSGTPGDDEASDGSSPGSRQPRRAG